MLVLAAQSVNGNCSYTGTWRVTLTPTLLIVLFVRGNREWRLPKMTLTYFLAWARRWILQGWTHDGKGPALRRPEGPLPDIESWGRRDDAPLGSRPWKMTDWYWSPFYYLCISQILCTVIRIFFFLTCFSLQFPFVLLSIFDLLRVQISFQSLSSASVRSTSPN